MNPKIICPVCKSQLQRMTQGHIDTKKHFNALKKAGIDISKDPALDLIKPVQKKESKNQFIEQIEYKLANLENAVKHLQLQQEQIFNYLNLKSDKIIEQKIRDIKPEDILAAINKCIQNNQRQSRWVKIDDVISLLKINREDDLNNLNNILINMFNKNMIDLAEGGDPKYPIIYQNRIYGMITHQ